MRKLARRNRPAAAAAAALTLTLVIATVVSIALAGWALRQRAGALRAQRESQDVSDMLSQLMAGAHVLQDVHMLDVLAYAEQAIARGVPDDPRLEATLREYVGDGYLKASRPDLALPHVDRALEVRRSLPTPDFALARAMRLAAKARFGLRRMDEGRALILEALKLRRQLFGPAHVQTHPDGDLMFFVNYYLPEEPEARLDRASVEAAQRAQSLLARDAIANPRVSAVSGTLVFEDNFNGPEVGPAWSLRLEESTGWTHRFDNSRLIVDGVHPRRVSTHANVPNSLVTLERRFAPLGDFHVRAVLGWDNRGNGSVMHAVHVEVVGQNRIIAAATYQDAAAYYFGGRPVASVVDTEASGAVRSESASGAELPNSGEAVVEIERLGDTVTVFWTGGPLIQARSSGAAVAVRVRFGHLAVSNRDFTSHFAPLWADSIRVQGVPIDP